MLRLHLPVAGEEGDGVRVAVITMTRDRVDYTRYCFASLSAHAGCEYDHFVLDQGSTDGTLEYLSEWVRNGQGRSVIFSKTNLGICKAANALVLQAAPSRYDVIVRYDNDCELTQPDTLKTCADLAHRYGAIVAPSINGLNHPPQTIRTVSLGGHLLDEKPILGGIFMCIPAFAFDECGYRFDERSPLATGDEAIVPWWRGRGGVAGWLQDVSVNHYETSEGQKSTYPEYEERKRAELQAA